MSLVVRGLEQDCSRQAGRKRLERFVEVSGCARPRYGEGQCPGTGGGGVEGHGRWCVRLPAVLRLRDENNVVRQRRAVESVDAQADRPARKCLR